jgi:LysR family cys regulon transcriptional activator
VQQRDAREYLLAANTIYIALRLGHFLRSFGYLFIELCSPKLDEAAIRAGIALLLEAGK